MKKIFVFAVAALCICACGNSKKNKTVEAETVVELSAADSLDIQYAANLLPKGTKAPEFTITNVNGQSVSLSDYAGKWLVIDFWASWCGDCRRDIPNIKAAYERFSPKGVEFLGVSFDDDREAWVNAINDFELPYTQVSELKKWRSTDISPLYKLDWIPTMYVINPQGEVALATVLSEKMTAFLAEVTE